MYPYVDPILKLLLHSICHCAVNLSSVVQTPKKSKEL